MPQDSAEPWPPSSNPSTPEDSLAAQMQGGGFPEHGALTTDEPDPDTCHPCWRCATSPRAWPLQALRDVTLAVLPQTIHAVVGENGAGEVDADEDHQRRLPARQLWRRHAVEGKQQSYAGLRDSEAKGIVIVHQELALVPLLSVMENPSSAMSAPASAWWTARPSANWAVRRWPRWGLMWDLDTPVERLRRRQAAADRDRQGPAQGRAPLILDEPTASLNEVDSQALLDLDAQAQERGHHLHPDQPQAHEVACVADHITALRDGATVTTSVVPKARRVTTASSRPWWAAR